MIFPNAEYFATEEMTTEKIAYMYSRSEHYRKTVAQRCKSWAVLNHLKKDSNASVREAIAGNQNAPTKILNHLKHDPNYLVRLAIVLDNSPTPSILNFLANDENNDIRATVAWHRNTSVTTLKKLTQDNCPSVRFSVAVHPNCTLEILEKELVRDTSSWVAYAAQRSAMERFGKIY